MPNELGEEEETQRSIRSGVMLTSKFMGIKDYKWQYNLNGQSVVVVAKKKKREKQSNGKDHKRGASSSLTEVYMLVYIAGSLANICRYRPTPESSEGAGDLAVAA
jgi:hypothetical protein